MPVQTWHGRCYQLNCAVQVQSVARMSFGPMITTKPIFYAVLGEGQRWRVEVEWPDGTIEQVDEFKLFSEATDWICSQSETWWQRRD
jgi:hypothetical protein